MASAKDPNAKWAKFAATIAARKAKGELDKAIERDLARIAEIKAKRSETDDSG